MLLLHRELQTVHVSSAANSTHMGRSEPRVGPTEASSGRLLVLEVTTNQDAKVLRTVDLASRKQLNIALCDDWIESEVKQGDIVRVILTHEDGTFQLWDENTHEDIIPLLVTNELHFFVLHSDTLVSATSVADSLKCLRKAVLTCRTPSGMPAQSAAASEAAVFGNLIHDLFQIILASDSNTRDYQSPQCISQTGGVDVESFFEAVEEVLYRHYESLYAAKILDQNARQVLHKVIPDIMEWYKVFMGSGNHTSTIGGLLRDGKSSHRVVVKEVHDIEELMWSPVLGLKGKIDASVQLRVDEADTGVGVFELKTGNSLGYSSVAHNAQTLLYTLLMSDRNSRFVRHGLLTYIQYQEALRSILPEKYVDRPSNRDSSASKPRSSKTIEGAQKNRIVIPMRGELVALMIQRNRLATYLRPSTAIDDLPPLLQGRPEVCSKCFVNGSCMLQYKQLEGGLIRNLSEGPGIDLFKEKTSHLTKEHEDYYRFWRSVLAKEEEHAGRSSRELWSKEGRKREAEGECLSNLMLMPAEPSNSVSPHELLTLGNRICATFTRHLKSKLIGDLSKTRVAKGDYVVVSAERTITDKQEFAKSYGSTFTWQCGLTNGFVSCIDSKTVSVLVGRSLSAWTLHQGLSLSEIVWRIDCEEIYSSHSTSKRTIENLFCDGDDEITTKLRQLIVDGKAPRFNKTDNTQSRINEKRKSYSLSLNADQRRAVEMSLRAEDYLLILGMPGTGKTTTLAAIVLAFASREKSVLLCSHTNTAVDNLLVKLLDLGFSDFVRLGRNLDVIDKRIHDNHISKICKPGIGTEQLEKDLDAPRVLATTCLGINHAVLARRTEFDLVVVDEASQILQPICIGPLQFANSAFILVGDHYQLPPLQRSSGGNRRPVPRLANKRRCTADKKAMQQDERAESPNGTENESLFRRLCIKHPEAMVSLSLQYRMSGQIMGLSNELVYCGNLQCATKAVEMQALQISGEWIPNMLPWLRAVRDPSKKIILLDTSEMESKDECKSNDIYNKGGPGSNRRANERAERENEFEIDTVIKSVRCLMEAGVALSDITVLSPFRAQVHLTRERLAEKFESGNSLGERPCQVFTIDQYQGKDNRCVMVSFVRSRMNPVGPLLQDWRRINVAVTRAKQKLILIGCAKTLARGSSFLEAMISWLRTRNLIYTVSALPERRLRQ